MMGVRLSNHHGLGTVITPALPVLLPAMLRRFSQCDPTEMPRASTVLVAYAANCSWLQRFPMFFVGKLIHFLLGLMFFLSDK
mmetsp:Transcript_24030/g.51227  ORF Transcript_24030/g.51227 Transcript_24030/m.51227 type:complete len:82 (-) Transcript_24030:141-386(-)